MRKELQLIGAYIRAVLHEWWAFVVEVLLLLTDVTERFLGTWFLPSTRTKLGIGLSVLIIAQYRAYRRVLIHREMLRMELEGLRAAPPATKLEIHAEHGSQLYVEHPHINPRRTYFEFHLTVQNSGAENSVIRKFDVQIEGQSHIYEDLPPTPRNMVPTRSAQMMTPHGIHGRPFITVPAHDAWTGILMFEVAGVPIEAGPARCTLILTDSNGTSATCTFDMRVNN